MAIQTMITKRFGKRAYHFTLTGNDFHEVVTEINRLSFDDVAACGICGSEDLELAAREAQGKYKYVSVKCRACKADATFGKRQDDDKQVFIRKNESGGLDWRAWEKEGGQNNG